MNYQNKLGAFENSVEESKNQLNNFTNRRDEIVGDNKKLLSSAKALQSSDLIQGVISNMSGVVGLKSLKEVGSKGLSWVDKKLGGKIARDTKGFKNIVKKKGQKLLKKGIKQVSDKVKGVEGEGKEVELQDTSPESQTENAVKTSTVEDSGEMGTGEMKESGEAYEDEAFENEAGGVFDESNATAQAQELDENINKLRTGGLGGEGKPAQQKSYPDEEFEKGADEDVSNENKFESDTKTVDAENAGIDKTNKTDGADDDDEDVDPEADADDVADKLAEKASASAVDEGVGNTLEGVGLAADSTGIGALVGVPLEIAGGIADLVGVVEAGKSFGDWFSEDVLGNKPPVKAQHIAMPKAPSTLASQGFQATPSYSSAVETSGGVGGW